MKKRFLAFERQVLAAIGKRGWLIDLLLAATAAAGTALI